MHAAPPSSITRAMPRLRTGERSGCMFQLTCIACFAIIMTRRTRLQDASDAVTLSNRIHLAQWSCFPDRITRNSLFPAHTPDPDHEENSAKLLFSNVQPASAMLSNQQGTRLCRGLPLIERPGSSSRCSGQSSSQPSSPPRCCRLLAVHPPHRCQSPLRYLSS